MDKYKHEREMRRAELWQLIRDVSEAEELPISSIRELANAHVIPIDAFVKAWEALCSEGWSVVELAEERMEAVE